MEIGIRVWPSKVPNEDDPGHLFVFWTDDVHEMPQFRGFIFRPGDLPQEAREAHNWRSFLFDHKVPGYVDGGHPRMADEYFQKRIYMDGRQWVLTSGQVGGLEQTAAEGPQGWYSFNPDQHNAAPVERLARPDRCHNCVTWGITLVHETLQRKVLLRVKNGRIKRMIRALKMMRDCEARRGP